VNCFFHISRTLKNRLNAMHFFITRAHSFPR